MALLKLHNNVTLRELFNAALERGASVEELDRDFGTPPFHFFGPRTGPVAPYHAFRVTYADREGRQYSDLEPGTVGVRIPIAIRRKNPAIQFPQPGETIRIVHLKNSSIRQFYVVSTQLNKTRSATAWLEISE